MHTLEKSVNDIPILGELPRLTKSEKKIVVKDDRSVLAEALRIIRANLDYLLQSKKNKDKSNVIFVTSSVPGEGKTFFSVNLSMILASTRKRILLIGADVRNPKFKRFFINENIDVLGKKDKNRERQIGLTEYLHKTEVEFKEIVNTLLVHENYIDVIFSGKIPPNPSELLLNGRMGDLIEEASRKYDYIVVDTAPMMVVSDTLLISKYATQLVYVTRADKTETNALEFPIKLQEEGKIDSLSFIVNDVKSSNLGYGGKYGYGYGQQAKKWWKF